MRVVQFLQVVLLLFLIGYAVLVYLENPVLLRLPLLFAGRELVLPAGLGLGLGVLVGALYGALLILPRYLRQRLLRRGDLTRRRDAETRGHTEPSGTSAPDSRARTAHTWAIGSCR